MRPRALAREGTVELLIQDQGEGGKFGEDAEASVGRGGCGAPRGQPGGLRTAGLRQTLGTEMTSLSVVMGN